MCGPGILISQGGQVATKGPGDSHWNAVLGTLPNVSFKVKILNKGRGREFIN